MELFQKIEVLTGKKMELFDSEPVRRCSPTSNTLNPYLYRQQTMPHPPRMRIRLSCVAQGGIVLRVQDGRSHGSSS